MQKTLGLYLHKHSRFLEKEVKGTITLFNLSSLKLKVPSISRYVDLSQDLLDFLFILR